MVDLTPALLGASLPQGDADTVLANRLTASSFRSAVNGDVVDSLSAYLGPAAADDHIALALYSDLYGTPRTLLASASATTGSGTGWYTLPISPTTLAGDRTYWIVNNSDGSGDDLYYLDNGSGFAVYSDAATYASWPTVWPGTVGYGAPSYLLYATIARIPGSSLGPPGRDGDLDSGNENTISASPFTTGATGVTIKALAARLQSQPDSGDEVALVLYTDSGGSPGDLVVSSASTAAVTADGGGYDTVPIPPTTLAANTTYWIAFNSNASDTVLTFDADQAGSYVSSTTATFGTWPSSFPSLGRSGTPAYLLYAIEGGADSPTPTATATPTTATATATSPTPPATDTATATPVITPITRTIAYTYDGVQRLTGAVESPGSSYDLAGNRTGVTVDGASVASYGYDAADQVVGWTYDNAGNLTSDGTTSYSYDATNDLTGTTAGTQTTGYAYNGDGTLVAQTANGTITNYTQDLAASESQVLAATIGFTTTDYLYGQDTAPLAALNGSTRTWFGIDGQGSVRQSLDDTGNILGSQSYDPFGQIEAGSTLTGPFGYTDERLIGSLDRGS